MDKKKKRQPKEKNKKIQPKKSKNKTLKTLKLFNEIQ